MRLPKKISIAHLPTKIQKLSKFTKSLNLPVKLYVKRDDETGIYVTGNKIRKLEYIASYAVEKGYDTLVTCGGTQSNHARTTAYVATYLGMDSYLVLKGNEPSSYDGNYFLDKLFGAKIRWVTEEEYSNNIEAIFNDVKRELELNGKKPLIVPEGASYYLGMFGYMEATKELREQLDSMNLTIDYTVSAVGSGGTLAGFLMGQKVFPLDTTMYGINVCDDAEFFVEKILDLVQDFKNRYPEYGEKAEITREDIKIIDGYVGEGYGIPYKEEIEMIKLLARTEGIILDPTYTGKAFYGLIKEIQKGTFRENSKILFVHTGGIYGIFPQRVVFDFK